MAQALGQAIFEENLQEDRHPDYREFLPRGKTRFGKLTGANEQAFLAQFPGPTLNFASTQTFLEI